MPQRTSHACSIHECLLTRCLQKVGVLLRVNIIVAIEAEFAFYNYPTFISLAVNWFRQGVDLGVSSRTATYMVDFILVPTPFTSERYYILKFSFIRILK